MVQAEIKANAFYFFKFRISYNVRNGQCYNCSEMRNQFEAFDKLSEIYEILNILFPFSRNGKSIWKYQS